MIAEYRDKTTRHIIESQQFTPSIIQTIFDSADKFEKAPGKCMEGKIMASLFYEPSTRTRFSFESAMLRLGGNVLTTENAKEFSSTAKGESLEDSIKVVSKYSDVIVLRHPEQNASKRAMTTSCVPIINAGDGAGQHPTQALLDLYTIYKKIGRLEKLKIALVGDLKYGRTVHSLSYLLGKYKDIEIIFVSPEELKMKDDIKEYLDRHDIKYREVRTIEECISEVDVLYQTRIQKERFEDPQEYEKLKGVYQLDKETALKMKKEAIIMHPLPRIDEIKTEVDELEQAVYFDQAYYGLLIRMALLCYIVS